MSSLIKKYIYRFRIYNGIHFYLNDYFEPYPNEDELLIIAMKNWHATDKFLEFFDIIVSLIKYINIGNIYEMVQLEPSIVKDYKHKGLNYTVWVEKIPVFEFTRNVENDQHSEDKTSVSGLLLVEDL